MNSLIDARLAKFIETRDKRIAKFWPHYPALLKGQFDELLERGRVVVGGRCSCGSTGPTMKALRFWNEVVRKARSIGYRISEEPVRKIGNAWATRGGGFWDESEYRLEATAKDSSVVDELN